MNPIARRYAVFGYPVRHSLSPRIHAAFAAQFGIELEYRAIEVEPAGFALALASFHQEGGAGANVTLPLKELAVSQVRTMDRAARRAGAVNTLIRNDEGWDGVNTDGLGLIADLRRLGLALEGLDVLVLGAGGAVRGIVGPLLDVGVQSIRLLNRNPTRARVLADDFADPRLRAVEAVSTESLRAPDLLIHAASAGHSGERPEWPKQLCDAGTVAYDLSYGPAAAHFLEWATTRGSRIARDGLGMLVGQAAEAFARWHGVVPEVESVLAELRERLDGPIRS